MADSVTQWLADGSPTWDACGNCGHPRWAHAAGKCDRMSEAAHYKKPCRCKAFVDITAAVACHEETSNA